MARNELVYQQDCSPDIHTEVTVERACVDPLDRIRRLAMGSIVDTNIHSAKRALGGIEQCRCRRITQVGTFGGSVVQAQLPDDRRQGNWEVRVSFRYASRGAVNLSRP
jgi:hypothetical protein